MQTILRRRQMILSAAALGASAFLLTACGGGGGGTHLDDRRNLMELSESKPELSVFVEAVNSAGLRDTLTASGTNTVFAPNNDAFNALLAEMGTTKDALFANKPLLTAVLKYHILGKVMTKDIFPLGEAVEPMAGGFFKIEKQGDAYRVTDGRNRVTNIVSTDSVALNGVLHVLDRVLLPADKDIVQTVQVTPGLTTLAAAIAASDLTDTLKGAGPFTLFAPTDAAFAAVLAELGITQAALLADKAMLHKVLSYHVLGTRYLKKNLPPNLPLVTLEGSSFSLNGLQITDERGRLSNITTTDIFNTNGVIHIIDKVLLPL
ncbi:fasciclin domain-containing protein [Variovorax sp. J22R133]|uniref:fasciclin domain-containing protein n=1 Tax=Variovorax brevis TaxID=3053503 RepID=UPI002576680B|nr:fasciclin domain-containing protein [Variovorax sp. J22R133]MDM0114919.1 fasciclin domain-containing protein [Variovorax sp. J22R133]